MVAAGITAINSSTAHEALSGRFLIRLSDPLSSRLLDVAAVAGAAAGLTDPWALELRAPGGALELWRAWVESVASSIGARSISVGAPAAHARVIRNGEKI
jgi:hypothetical protein